MPPRRAKSQSISSDAPAVVSSMSPPASPKVSSKALKALNSRSPSVTSHASPPATRVSVAKQQKSTAPSVLRFPLVVLLSFSLSALLFSLTAEFTAGELAAISKHLQTWPEVLGVVGWKVVELSVFWFSGYDAIDTFSLATLLSYPSQILLLYFYNIRPTTQTLSAVINIASTTLPFVLLRPVSPVHSNDPIAQKQIHRVTRAIVSDPATTLFTSLLGCAIFGVILELAFATSLPTFLITYFDGIVTVEPAHRGAAGLPVLLLQLFPAGLAAREFLFVPSTATSPSASDKAYAFDPSTATFGQTIYHNVWGWYSPREKALIRRTVLAVGLIAMETAIQVWGTIKGVEFVGAVGYAGIWAGAVAIVGVVYSWVGGPSGF